MYNTLRKWTERACYLLSTIAYCEQTSNLIPSVNGVNGGMDPSFLWSVLYETMYSHMFNAKITFRRKSIRTLKVPVKIRMFC
jgi:hypothetical protein